MALCTLPRFMAWLAIQPKTGCGVAAGGRARHARSQKVCLASASANMRIASVPRLTRNGISLWPSSSQSAARPRLLVGTTAKDWVWGCSLRTGKSCAFSEGLFGLRVCQYAHCLGTSTDAQREQLVALIFAERCEAKGGRPCRVRTRRGWLSASMCGGWPTGRMGSGTTTLADLCMPNHRACLPKLGLLRQRPAPVPCPPKR